MSSRDVTVQGRAQYGPAVPTGAARLASVTLGTPLVLFLLLRLTPALDRPFPSPMGHFIIVTAVSALALALAVAVAWAARSLPDARTFFLAMGFLTMSGVFLAHALGTMPRSQAAPAPAAASIPDEPYAAANEYGEYGPTRAPATPAGVHAHGAPSGGAAARLQVAGLSAYFSLLLSALCFALASADLPRRLADGIVHRWTPLALVVAALLALYGLTALFAPAAVLRLPIAHWPPYAIAALTWLCLAFAAWRFAHAYRLTALPLQGTMALGTGLLAEAQLFMVEGRLWAPSWWEYHVVMYLGFLAPVLALLWQYRRAGDLAVLVEGLFLRHTMRGLQAGDPHALTALAAAVAAKDSETGAHTERVGELAVRIARRVGLPEERMEVLRWAGRLHDLGKIGVPNRILGKPGPLTPAEFDVMKQHPVRGWRVAVRAGVLAQAAPIIRAHHERLDGSGYPDGLRGEAIPLEARIVAVADVWDALTSDRPYRKAMPLAQAVAVIRAEAGSRLDPRCVDALLAELGLRAAQVA
jgi:HD-GYP domain-containing protein (c-di-GMP phosphodiesterase class II)